MYLECTADPVLGKMVGSGTFEVLPRYDIKNNATEVI